MKTINHARNKKLIMFRIATQSIFGLLVPALLFAQSREAGFYCDTQQAGVENDYRIEFSVSKTVSASRGQYLSFRVKILGKIEEESGMLAGSWEGVVAPEMVHPNKPFYSFEQERERIDISPVEAGADALPYPGARVSLRVRTENRALPFMIVKALAPLYEQLRDREPTLMTGNLYLENPEGKTKLLKGNVSFNCQSTYSE